MFKGTLIRSGGNAKTIKGDKAGDYETAIMYLAPVALSGMGNVCPMAKQAACEAACLFKAGRGVYNNVEAARVAKTRRYFADRSAFMEELFWDLFAFVRYCRRRNIKPAVRLNGTSDIQWEVAHPVEATKNGVTVRYPSILEAFPEVQFYDYTKVAKRAYRKLPENYRLTLSYSHARQAYADEIVKAAMETGLNLAVVYRSKALAAKPYDTLGSESIGFMSREVIDGDKTDMRFTDPSGVIVGLYAKGPAKRDRTGFVIG